MEVRVVFVNRIQRQKEPGSGSGVFFGGPLQG